MNNVQPALAYLAPQDADLLSFERIPKTTLGRRRPSSDVTERPPWRGRLLKKQAENDERLYDVAAWRDTPYFTDAERAAPALTESATRLADREDPIPDDIWDEAARHYDEPALAALIIAIATINVWNRLNVATRQVAGEWAKSAKAKHWVESHAAAR